MKRKIVMHGKTSLTISLPIKWVQKYNLNRGDEVDVTEEGNRLIVSTETDMETDARSVNLKSFNTMLHKAVSSLYCSGYDELELVFNDTDQQQKIHDTINKEYVGFEIVDEGSKHIRARKISSIYHEEFGPILKRLFHLLISIGEDTLKALEKKDYEVLKSITIRDHNINKLCDFCVRALNKRDEGGFKKSKPLYYIVEQLERIGDLHKEISRLVVDSEIDVSKETLEVYRLILDYFREYYELFYKFRASSLEEFGRKRIDIQARIENLIDSVPRKEIRVAMYMNNLYFRIYGMIGSMMILYL